MSKHCSLIRALWSIMRRKKLLEIYITQKKDIELLGCSKEIINPLIITSLSLNVFFNRYYF